jgi:hypothetical protein
MVLGTSLIIWDRARDRIDDDHRNPDYQKPVKLPKDATPATLGAMPVLVPGGGGLGLGGVW